MGSTTPSVKYLNSRSIFITQYKNEKGVCSPVDPVRNVQCPIRAQRRQIVCRNGLRLACPLQQKELWQDGNSFEENRERPENLCEPEPVVEQQREQRAGSDEVLQTEGVDGRVVRGAVFVLHKVENVAAARNEEDLHGEVVQGDPFPEQVEVPRDEDHDV